MELTPQQADQLRQAADILREICMGTYGRRPQHMWETPQWTKLHLAEQLSSTAQSKILAVLAAHGQEN